MNINNRNITNIQNLYINVSNNKYLRKAKMMKLRFLQSEQNRLFKRVHATGMYNGFT